jgi:hypothetical protein
MLITDGNGCPVVAVEVKNRQALTRDVAVQLRRNLLVHRALGDAAYFLLLSQDRGYLWTDAQKADMLALPAREFPMQAVVARYVGRTDRAGRLRESAFAAMVFRWLQALTVSPNGVQDEAERVLRETGVIDAIRGGSVSHQAVA